MTGLLPHLEAILTVYNLMGRRDNKYKARIKILLHAMGINEFKKRVNEVSQRINETFTGDKQVELDRIIDQFAPQSLPSRCLDPYHDAIATDPFSAIGLSEMSHPTVRRDMPR